MFQSPDLRSRHVFNPELQFENLASVKEPRSVFYTPSGKGVNGSCLVGVFACAYVASFYFIYTEIFIYTENDRNYLNIVNNKINKIMPKIKKKMLQLHESNFFFKLKIFRSATV